nr:MAG TPA: hypothetical protein [Caudoviricetes sp.]
MDNTSLIVVDELTLATRVSEGSCVFAIGR